MNLFSGLNWEKPPKWNTLTGLEQLKYKNNIIEAERQRLIEETEQLSQEVDRLTHLLDAKPYQEKNAEEDIAECIKEPASDVALEAINHSLYTAIYGGEISTIRILNLIKLVAKESRASIENIMQIQIINPRVARQMVSEDDVHPSDYPEGF